MALDVPAHLAPLGRTADGAAWLERLPRLVDECVERWDLRVAGTPFDGSQVSLVVPVTTAPGDPAVLKLQLPHRESEHEADALARWGGDGATRLLDRDRSRHALLVERCLPGTHLRSVDDADTALDVFVDLLPRLLVPATNPFTPLATEAALLAAGLPATWERAGRPFDRRLLDAAVDALTGLPVGDPDADAPVLIHQDLHADNVLAAEREPWLAIDPKPLVGERAFAAVPIVRSYELGHGRQEVLHRLDRVTAEVGLDRERARWWAVGHTVAWAFDGDRVLPRHVETAGWLLGDARP